MRHRLIAPFALVALIGCTPAQPALPRTMPAQALNARVVAVGADVVHLQAGGQVLVQAQAQPFVGDVVRWDVRGQGQRDADLGRRLHDLAALAACHRIAQQVVVELQPHSGDLAVLDEVLEATLRE